MFCFLWRKEAATEGGQLKGMPLKILQKLTGKYQCRSLYFNEVAAFKRRRQRRYFIRKFCKILKKYFLKNTSVRLLLNRIQIQ